MPLYLVIASATVFIDAESAEDAKEEADSSLDWEVEIEGVQEYEDCADGVMRPKAEAK